MEAIVKVNQTSAFANLNGHTFQVKEITESFCALSILNEIGQVVTTDFSLKEVIIVDLRRNIAVQTEQANKSKANSYYALIKYAKENNIKL